MKVNAIACLEFELANYAVTVQHSSHDTMETHPRLCGRDKTVNPIIRECRKLALKEYKSSHDWIGKVIH